MTNLAWDDALWGLAALSADPEGLKGIWLKCPLGPVMQEWLNWLHALKGNSSKLPANIDTERLLGGLDLALTLQMGRTVRQKGVLAQSDGRLLVCPMAERLPQLTTSILTQVLDSKAVDSHFGHETQVAKFGLVAIDESTQQEESISSALAEQLSMWLDLSLINPNTNANDETLDMLERVEKKLHERDLYYSEKIKLFKLDDAHIHEICELAQGFGIDSMRPPLFAIRLATVFALLRDSVNINADDLGRAARLVLTPRATRMPQMEQDPSDQPPPESDQEESAPPEQQEPTPNDTASPDSEQDTPPPQDPSEPSESEIKEMQTSILEAALATLPAGLLNQLANGQSLSKKGAGGRVGEIQRGAKKGRPLPAIQGLPQNGNRLHILSTLRHAAPRQKIRGNESFSKAPPTSKQSGSHKRLKIWSEDFHIQRFAKRSESCIIFCIDASGSAALERLAEAKGAVELLLKDSYARRDHICVISFRDKAAQIQLPATRSLVRAKRQLQALPGGGGTPLASALQLALETALQARQHGMSPTLVILSDGRANVTLQGEGSRPIAKAQAVSWAKQWRATHIKGIWLDTSARPEANAQEIAMAMGADYVPLPLANGQKMAKAIENIQSLQN
jgi:magnesium chelatase subunit D